MPRVQAASHNRRVSDSAHFTRAAIEVLEGAKVTPITCCVQSACFYKTRVCRALDFGAIAASLEAAAHFHGYATLSRSTYL